MTCFAALQRQPIPALSSGRTSLGIGNPSPPTRSISASAHWPRFFLAGERKRATALPLLPRTAGSGPSPISQPQPSVPLTGPSIPPSPASRLRPSSTMRAAASLSFPPASKWISSTPSALSPSLSASSSWIPQRPKVPSPSALLWLAPTTATRTATRSSTLSSALSSQRTLPPSFTHPAPLASPRASPSPTAISLQTRATLPPVSTSAQPTPASLSYPSRTSPLAPSTTSCITPEPRSPTAPSS